MHDLYARSFAIGSKWKMCLVQQSKWVNNKKTEAQIKCPKFPRLPLQHFAAISWLLQICTHQNADLGREIGKDLKWGERICRVYLVSCKSSEIFPTHLSNQEMERQIDGPFPYPSLPGPSLAKRRAICNFSSSSFLPRLSFRLNTRPNF